MWPPLWHELGALIDAIAGGDLDSVTIVTRDRELARDVRRRIDAAHFAHGHQVWARIEVLPWSSWLPLLWSSWTREAEHDAAGRAALTLLTSIQELSIWESIVRADLRADQPHVPVRTIANSARAARYLAYEWAIDTRIRRERDGADADRFGSWHRRYQAILNREAWIDVPAATTVLVSQFADCEAPWSNYRVLTKHLVLCGFASLPPLHRQLLDALGRHREVGLANNQSARVSRDATEFSDADSELECAAAWSRRCLEQARDQGDVRVGVVISNLAAKRAKVERIFSAHLDSGGERLDSQSLSGFRIAVAIPLHRQPMIHSALLTLKLATGALTVSEVGTLLRSPFLAKQSEFHGRAQIDFRLRQLGAAAFRLADLLRLCADRENQADDWSRVLRTLASEDLQTTHAPAVWAHLIDQVLRECGWPGERPLTVVEHDVLNAWHHCLSQLTTLGLVVNRCRLVETLHYLNLIASRQSDSPRHTTAPVQIVDSRAAGGLEFTHLWITGMHDANWPAPASPNPFLPFWRLRAVDHPDVDAKAARRLAGDQFALLCDSAPVVVASSSRRDGQSAQMPSPILDEPRFDFQHRAVQNITAASVGAESLPAGRAQQLLRAAPRLQVFVDDNAPALSAGARHGGVDIFTRQSGCPFQAMMAYRLKVHALEDPSPGIDARERGILMHLVCDLVWSRLGDSNSLRALTAREREPIVDTIVGQAVASRRQYAPHRYTNASARLEQRRASRLITALLEAESLRDDFTVIATEQRRQVEIGGIAIDTRIDRVDRLANGDELVVDYKTGIASTSKWALPRPEEPQLPIYALTFSDAVRGIAFIELRQGGAEYKGLGEYDMAPGIKSIAKTGRAFADVPDWPSLRGAWQREIDSLAAAFTNGDARVAPKNAGICRRCRFAAVCRIQRDDGEDDTPSAGELEAPAW